MEGGRGRSGQSSLVDSKNFAAEKDKLETGGRRSNGFSVHKIRIDRDKCTPIESG